MLAVEGIEPVASPVHHLLDDGSFAITVPETSPLSAMAMSAGSAGVQAVLEMTDYAPLPLREPVRSLVWIRGRLQHVPSAEVAALLDLVAAENPNPALLQVNSKARSDAEPDDDNYTLMRLEIESVVVADSTGAEAVGLGALLQARPDPFCAMESGWLQHLESSHRDVVERLATRLPMTLRQGRVRPLGLDRYGVQLRVENEHGDHDVRLPFPKPVDDVTGLSQAIRVLMGCPFLNGLRARRI
ncbi:prephenate dehydratase [Mycolicibacterium boenickei]|nr:prephenate dehydratase [Mycolicibacterium boenickei]